MSIHSCVFIIRRLFITLELEVKPWTIIRHCIGDSEAFRHILADGRACNAPEGLIWTAVNVSGESGDLRHVVTPSQSEHLSKTLEKVMKASNDEQHSAARQSLRSYILEEFEEMFEKE